MLDDHPQADRILVAPWQAWSPRGRNGGRPIVMDADKLAAAEARRARGESPTEIAKALGVSRASVYRHLSAAAGKI
jgi:DNA invertase Pin-like site-specific DNA recombinase